VQSWAVRSANVATVSSTHQLRQPTRLLLIHFSAAWWRNPIRRTWTCYKWSLPKRLSAPNRRSRNNSFSGATFGAKYLVDPKSSLLLCNRSPLEKRHRPRIESDRLVAHRSMPLFGDYDLVISGRPAKVV
jgi:hypothetical protein